MRYTQRQQAIKFFQEHAGYCTPPGRMVCAKQLADAEEQAEELGLQFLWLHDSDVDLSWLEDWPEHDRRRYNSTEHEYFVCLVYDADGNDTLAILGQIDTPTISDQRVYQAELASEAIADLNRNVYSQFPVLSAVS